MFDWFFNWLDPKILNMERWVNHKVVEPDKLDIDLDKVKKGCVSKSVFFTDPVKGREETGPMIANIQGARLIGYLTGINTAEAFGLFLHNGSLLWRHRDAGTTQDYTFAAFDGMNEFFLHVHNEQSLYWDCCLRTAALFGDKKGGECVKLSIHDLKDFIKEWKNDHPKTA